MVLECSAIITVILVMSFMMLRSGRRGYAIGTLPLIIVPTTHIGGSGISRLLSEFIPLDFLTIRIGIDVLGLVLACILFGIFSHGIKNKKARLLFLVMCGGFSAILTCVLLINYVSL